MKMRKLTHNDVVLFDTKEQLEEYIKLSGDTDICEKQEISGIFPRIQSENWSFHCSFNNGNHFEIKQTALTRLVSYAYFKSQNQLP